MNRALRGLLEEEGGPEGRPTSLGLVERLVRAAPERDRALVEEWLTRIVLYDLRVESASAAPRDDGRYDVTVRVAASRSAFDGAGNESPLGLDEAIDVGVYGGDGTALHLERHALREGSNEISVVVDAPPARVVVDPYVTRIDRNRFDNAGVVVRSP
jgi:hypothetical protein